MGEDIAIEQPDDDDDEKSPEELGLKEIPDEEAEQLPSHDEVPSEEG